MDMLGEAIEEEGSMPTSPGTVNEGNEKPGHSNPLDVELMLQS